MPISDEQKAKNLQKYAEQYGMGLAGQKAETNLRAFQTPMENEGLLLNEEATEHIKNNLQKIYAEKGITPEVARAMEAAIGVIHEKRIAAESPIAKFALSVTHTDKTLGVDKQSLKDYVSILQNWASDGLKEFMKHLNS